MATLAEYMATLGTMTPGEVLKTAAKKSLYVIVPVAALAATFGAGRYTAPSTVEKGNATIQGVEMFKFNDFILKQEGAEVKVVKVDESNRETYSQLLNKEGQVLELRVLGTESSIVENPTRTAKLVFK